MTVMIPLMIDLRDRRVVIYGGGNVAARKAAYFTGSATVIVVSRSFSRALDEMKIKRKRMDLSKVPDTEIKSFIRGAFLVIAATSDHSVNDRIGSLCRQEDIPFNNAYGTPGDVLLPATLQGENFLVAVTTYGKSPAFSRYLRSKLEVRKKDYDQMITLQERLRSVLKERIPTQRKREEILRNMVSDQQVWETLSQGIDSTWMLIERKYLRE